MKTIGFAILAILAIAFVNGVARNATRTQAPPARVQGDSAAAELVRTEQGMQHYLTDTPAELARLRREQARQLRALCRAGYVKGADCQK